MIYLKVYHFIEDFKKGEIAKLDNKINIIYRNYKKPIDEKIINKIKNECRKSGKKIFLSNNIQIAQKLNLDGAYIPSFNRELSVRALKNNNITLVGSAHNLKELNEKKKQGMDIIVLSPLFNVPKSKTSLGVIRFNILSKQAKLNTIALGGINEGNIKKLNMLNCYGFASISYLKKKNNITPNLK